MACHAIGQRSSPFLAEGRCRLRTGKSTGALCSSVSWRAAKEEIDCKNVVLCCRAASTAPSEEAIRSGGGMAEIGRSLLSMSLRENGMGIKRKDADGEATTSAASAERLDRWVQESVADVIFFPSFLSYQDSDIGSF